MSMDKVSIGSMLKKIELLSLNQPAAKIKLIEVWKSVNRQFGPIQTNQPNESAKLRPQGPIQWNL